MSDYTAEKIRYYRKTKHLTQAELAEACNGISFSSIRRYESVGEENRDPKTEDLREIARVLEVDPSVFIEPIVSFSDVEVIGEDGKTYLLDPSCEVLTRDGEQMFKAEFENAKESGLLTDDDLQPFYLKYPSGGSAKERIDAAMSKLNIVGQETAADRVEELTEIPKYQK